MRKLIIYFLILLVAVWIGVTIHHDPGYVLIAYREISIETSLWFVVISIVVCFLLLYALLRLSSGMRAVAISIRQWLGSHKKRRAHIQMVAGLYELVEGNWVGAEKTLINSAKSSSAPLVNYLAAALMAHNQHAAKRLNNYLRLAQKTARSRPLAAAMIQAHLHIVNKQWEEAAAVLQSVKQLQSKNVFILQLLYRVYVELKDWQNLKDLLPVLRKYRVLEIDAINQLELQVYTHLLQIDARNSTIEKTWQHLPHYLRKNPQLVAIYLQYLLAKNRVQETEELLKMVLRKNLDNDLLAIYANIVSEQPIKQLTRGEKWLQDNPEHPGLLLCLGRICRKQKLWGKSRHYLEKSAKIAPNMEVYAELAQIMIAQNDLQSAVNFYAKMSQVNV